MIAARKLLLVLTSLIWPIRAWSAEPPAGWPDGVRVDREVLAGVEDGAPVRSAGENYYEAQAYSYLLVRAHKAQADLLAKEATRDLSFVHLFEEPEKHRGKVIHLDGRVKRLTRFDPPQLAQKEGVRHLYEAWVFTETSYSNPYCVIFSELPPTLHIGEKLEDHVTFDGFFFKRYRYKAADGRWRDAPLLIGRELKAVPAASSTQNDHARWFSSLFLPGFLAVLGTTAALAFALAWWFRRGDRGVQARLHRLPEPAFFDPDYAADEAA
jgi:hypothetical protein